MTLRNICTVIVIVFLLGAGALFGVHYWKAVATEKRVTLAIDRANALLAKGDPDTAWIVIRSTRAPEKDSTHSDQWFDLLVELAVQTRQLDRLQHLREQNPSRFFHHPGAVDALQQLNLAEAGKLDDSLPSTPSSVLFKSDEQKLQGHPEKAIALLQSTKLHGKEEVARLLRLAQLNKGDLDAVRSYLGQAYTLDPSNVDTRTYIANILESSGDINDARDEYLAALSLAPENAHLRDNLAEFYIRQGAPALAISVWRQAGNPESDSAFPLKVWFWERMTSRPTTATSAPRKQDGKLKEPTSLLDLLSAIPQDQFWDDAMEGLYLKGTELPQNREIFWLRFLSMLQKGNDKDAWAFLSGVADKITASTPLLKDELLSILGVRTGILTKGTLPLGDTQAGSSPFLGWLKTHQDNAKELGASWVIPALYADNHWNEAAVELLGEQSLEHAPDWAQFMLVQAARAVGNQEAAEQIAARCPTSSLRILLEAEANLKNSKTAEATTLLEKILSDPAMGYRAAMLLSLAYLEAGKSEEITRVMALRPDFAESIAGKEVMARLYLRQGDEVRAVMIYEAIAEKSDDARIFLAHRAFVQHDWDRAEDLTRSLMNDHPGETTFLSNLQKIQAARLQPTPTGSGHQ